MTISGILVLMVGAVFLVQNEFYSWLLLRTQVQENARAMTELISSEIRSVPLGGVVLADSNRVVVRSPMVSAAICDNAGLFDAFVHIPGGTPAIDQTDVRSLGVLNSTTGVWTFYDATWGQLNDTGTGAPAACASNGADTTGASSEYRRLNYFTVTFGLPTVGNVMMIGRKTEFMIAPSTLSPGLIALYRGPYGGTLTEFATGIGSDAKFQYRYGTTTHYNSVTGGNLALIDGIRIVARSTGRGDSGAQTQYAFGWTVDVPLVNAR
jgi:hypothetical protein